MSGIEVAGVALAVVPIFIEAAKACAETYGAAKEAANPSRRNEKLQDFYDNFYYETFEIKQTIEQVVEQLPGLSESRKQAVLDIKDAQRFSKSWKDDTDVAESLKKFFVSASDLDTFLTTLKKVLRLFNKLVADETLQISEKEISTGQMFLKMKQFEEEETSGKIISTFKERFKFARRSKTRDTCLQNLSTWNKRLARVVYYATQKMKKHPVGPDSDLHAPSPKMRELSRKILLSLSRFWRCNCHNSHEAKLSLAACANVSLSSVISELYLRFLVRGSERINDSMWHEMMVTIRPIGNANTQGRELEKICDALNVPQATDSCLQILVEDADQQQRVWRLNPRSRPPDNNYNCAAKSFRSLLLETKEPVLLVKRKLALMFANSLLQFHESPLLSTEWDKDRIFFFHASTTSVDYEHPYLKAAMEEIRRDGEPHNIDLIHPNPGILKLGILLIELQLWKPIEVFREEGHLKDGEPTVNTDLLVAQKLLSEPLRGCFDSYRNAIVACMSTPWLSAGEIASLENEKTWKGVLDDVVRPLQTEVEFGQMAVSRPGQTRQKHAFP